MKIYIALLLLIIVLTACTQTKEFKEPSTVPTPPRQPTPEPDVNEPVDLGAREELQQFLRMEPDFSIEYNVVSKVNDEEFTATQKVAIKGDMSKQESELDSLYIADDKVYVCQKEEDWRCFDVPQDQPPEKIDLTIPTNVTVKKLADRTVVGETASCFELTDDSTAEGEDVVHCVAEDGLLLFFSRKSPFFEMEMTAKRVSRTVGSDEFRLPAPAEAFDPEEFSESPS